MTDHEDDHRTPNVAADEEGALRDVSRLLPTRLVFLLEECPVLWYENAEDYEALLAEIVADISPQDTTEWIEAKNVVDYRWEPLRYRRLKAAAIHAEMPYAAGRFLATDLRNGIYMDASDIRDLARAAAAGGEQDPDDNLSHRLKGRDITPDVRHYHAYKEAEQWLQGISQEVQRLDHLASRLLKQIEDRRAAVGAMSRSLLRREAVDVTAVPEPVK